MVKTGSIALIFLFIFCSSYAQLTSSPYSVFAAGQIESTGFGVISSMGSAGIAVKSNGFLNPINPASYHGLDSLSFLFELGLFGKYSTFYSQHESNNKLDGNLKYLALGFRINRWWAASAGLIPYSAVSYSISTTGNIEGQQVDYSKVYSGKGGINRLYFGNSFTPVKHLSVGINASYLFGTIVQSETAVTNDYFTPWSIDKTRYLHNLYLDYGLQYTLTKNNVDYSLGIIYGNKRELNTRNTFAASFDGDTVSIDDDYDRLFIPAKYGLGLAIEKTGHYRIALDYERNLWSSVHFTNSMLETRNSERFSAGMEFTPSNKGMDPGLVNLSYRLGANFVKSYLVIDNTPINSIAFTFGVGIPVRRDLSKINLSLEYGQNGTTRHSLIRENYWLLHLNLSFHDKWFKRTKFE